MDTTHMTHLNGIAAVSAYLHHLYQVFNAVVVLFSRNRRVVKFFSIVFHGVNETPRDVVVASKHVSRQFSYFIPGDYGVAIIVSIVFLWQNRDVPV